MKFEETIKKLDAPIRCKHCLKLRKIGSKDFVFCKYHKEKLLRDGHSAMATLNNFFAKL